MIPPPPPPIPGQAVSAGGVRALCDHARGLRVLAGEGVRVSYTPQGQVVSVRAVPSTAPSPAVHAWAVKSWDPRAKTLTLTNCCLRHGPNFTLLPDLSVTLAEGEWLVCADADLAAPSAALSAQPSADPAQPPDGTARVPLYAVKVDSAGNIGYLNDWRGAPELLVYV